MAHDATAEARFCDTQCRPEFPDQLDLAFACFWNDLFMPTLDLEGES